MRLYLKYFSMHLRAAMQYKASFFLTAAGQFIVSFSAFLAIYFLFQRCHAVEGFRFEQVLLCYAVVLTAFALSECFFRGFDTFAGIIGNGEFDRILVRPRNEIFQVIATKIEFTRIGRLLQAVAVLIYALPASGVEWNAARIFTLVLMILGGVGLFSGLFIIYAGICFFTLEGLEFMNIFTDGSKEFGSYPMAVYGKKLLRLYTYVIPLACVQYYPLLFLLGRENSPLYMLAPLAGLLFLAPALLVWRIGVRHYRSTGS